MLLTNAAFYFFCDELISVPRSALLAQAAVSALIYCFFIWFSCWQPKRLQLQQTGWHLTVLDLNSKHVSMNINFNIFPPVELIERHRIDDNLLLVDF